MFEDQIPVFKKIPRNFLKQIIERLEIEYFMPSDIVNKIQIKPVIQSQNKISFPDNKSWII